MEGSTRFQDSMQVNYQPSSKPMSPNQQLQGQRLSQPASQNQPFQGELLSHPFGKNQTFQGEQSSQPMGPNQPFQGQPLSHPMGPNQPFQCEPLSRSMSQKQPFQGQHLSQPMDQNQPLSQPMAQNLSFQEEPLNQPMGQTQPFLGEPLSQPFSQNHPFQGEPMSQPMGQNHPFHGQPLSQTMGQKQPFQGQPLSLPRCQNLSFQGEPLSQPVVRNQPFQGESSSQHMGQNHPSQGELPSQPRGPNQPCQGEPFPNIFSMQASYNKSHGRNCLNWTEEMARLLIIAISYIAEAESYELKDEANSKKLKLVSKTTMWKVISTVMSERGFNASPQQCEEKFRDINNKYKQMICLLGRATSCNVVENPILLDSINMPENKKNEARKLLQSNQFLYREMCSFHHGNRMFLPHDWELHRSVFLNLANNCDEHLKNQQRTGQNQNESKVLRARWVETEEKSLEVQEQRLQFEMARFQWLCFNSNEDLKLQKMRLENESLKLENAKLAYELKCRQKFSVDENH